MEYISAYYNNNPNYKIIFTAFGEEAFNTSVKFRIWPGRGRTMFKRHWKNIDKSNALLIVFIEFNNEKIPSLKIKINIKAKILFDQALIIIILL